MRDFNRRGVIGLVGGAAAWPLKARAQQGAMPVIGVLTIAGGASFAARMAALRQGFRESGFVEGQNVTIEYRFSAEGRIDQLRALAADIVRRQVNVIVTSSTAAALAAKQETTTIPIIFSLGSDPVKLGLVASLNRPGGNITGVSFLIAALAAKMLGFLRELLPGAARIAVLVDPSNPAITEPFVSDLRVAASAIGQQIEILSASTSREIDTVFANLPQKPVDALLVSPGMFFNRRVQLVTLATFHRVPAIYPWREAAEAGGLMSYGTSSTDAHRLAGIYTGRVLKGAKPADLPVMQPTKFEFVINLNTARAFGLSLPPGLLALADEVIE